MVRKPSKLVVALILLKATVLSVIVLIPPNIPLAKSFEFTGPRATDHTEGKYKLYARHGQKILRANHVFSGVKVEDSSAKMLVFGDLLLDRYVRTLIETQGMDAILQGVQGEGFFEGYDIVFANLEGPVTPHRIPTGKEIAFQFSPEHMEILSKNHFNLVSVANNHTFDMGQAGNDDTYKFLKERNIIPVGDARGISEKTAHETTINGQRIAFAAFNHSDFKLTIEEITGVIKDLKSRNDVVIVSIHWGVEYVHVPQEFQKDWARQMVEAGADVILGHHPHVLQGLEFIEGKPVFYSLGNFVFDQWFSEATQETVGVSFEFKEVPRHKKTTLIMKFFPIRLNKALPYFPDEATANQVMQNFYDYSFQTNPEIEKFRSLFDEREVELKL